MTEDTALEIDHYDGEGNRWTGKDIDRINETYDAYVVPLADAFRDDFANKLNNYANLFRKLKIPCYVIGVGLRAPYEPQISSEYAFDESVKNFVSAALERSAMIGLRGEITAAYLETLGFRPEQDFTVIGCPSMYTFGRQLHQRPLQLTGDSRISVNYSTTASEEVMRFLFEITQKYPNSQYVGQRTGELATLYIGKANLKQAGSYYPSSLLHPLYQQNKVRVFSSANSWFRNMESVDLSIGGRLHGNIAAILSGVPIISIPNDARMRELAAYHDFPCIPFHQLQTDLELGEAAASVDLRSHLRKHAANFDHFVDFLNQNGIRHIYQVDPERRSAPIDDCLPDAPDTYDYLGFEPATVCSREEILDRVLTYSDNLNRKQMNKELGTIEKTVNAQGHAIDELKKQNNELKKQNEELIARNKRLKSVLNSRSVKYSVKLRNLLVSKDKSVNLDDL